MFYCGFDLAIQSFSVLSKCLITKHLCQLVLLVAKMLLKHRRCVDILAKLCHHPSLAVTVIDGLLCLSVMKNVNQVQGCLQYTEKFIMATQMMTVMKLQSYLVVAVSVRTSSCFLD